ncbi:MAG: hypothetical protein U0Z44_12125 [Kouleothrix sp.]
MINKKICLLGDFAVGKTSLVRRYVYNRFEETYLSTIGDVSRKVVSVECGPRTIEVVLMLRDVASNNSRSKCPPAMSAVWPALCWCAI